MLKCKLKQYPLLREDDARSPTCVAPRRSVFRSMEYDAQGEESRRLSFNPCTLAGIASSAVFRTMPKREKRRSLMAIEAACPALTAA